MATGTQWTRARWFVGYTAAGKTSGVAFQAYSTPTPETTPGYLWVLGPFDTRRGAEWCVAHPYNTCPDVSSIEGAARIAAAAKR